MGSTRSPGTSNRGTRPRHADGSGPKPANPVVGLGWRRTLERLAGRFDMPQDVVLDLPKATLIGDLQVHVQNHRGVLEYTPRKIRVNTSKGELIITGIRLVISSIYSGELVVEGRITGVDYLR